MSPFKALYGYNPVWHISPLPTQVPATTDCLSEMIEIQKEAKASLKVAARQMKEHVTCCNTHCLFRLFSDSLRLHSGCIPLSALLRFYSAPITLLLIKFVVIPCSLPTGPNSGPLSWFILTLHASLIFSQFSIFVSLRYFTDSALGLLSKHMLL